MGNCLNKQKKELPPIMLKESIVTHLKNKMKFDIKKFEPKTYRHLVVDDSISNCFILKEYLNILDIQVDVVHDGVQALKMELEDYDIVWMDIRMPYMDGIECTRLLRNMYNYDGLIIAVTGDCSYTTMNQCYDMGINYTICKPIIYQDFLSLDFMQKYINGF